MHLLGVFLWLTPKKLCASIPVFKRLPKQNAFCFKKRLAMGCSVYIVENIERHNANEKQPTPH